MEAFGARKKFVFKIKKAGSNFEETQMPEEFEKMDQAYQSYHKSLSALLVAWENIVQPDRSVIDRARAANKDKVNAHISLACAEGADPFEMLYAKLKLLEQLAAAFPMKSTSQTSAYLLEHLVPGRHQHLDLLRRAAYECSKARREDQKQQGHIINKLRKFYDNEYQVYKERMQQFNNAKNAMDMAKHEVKQSKTTTEIEKRAVIYQQTVDAFDEQCAQAVKTLEQLPAIQQKHGEEVTKLFTAHKGYFNHLGNALK